MIRNLCLGRLVPIDRKVKIPLVNVIFSLMFQINIDVHVRCVIDLANKPLMSARKWSG